MVRWNQVRWSVGSSVLAALVVSGCGGAGRSAKPSLHATAELHLLQLVGRARTDVSDRNGAAARVALGQFIASVDKLQESGALTSTTATALHREASATASELSQQLGTTTTEDVAAQPAATTPTASPTSPSPSPTSASPKRPTTGPAAAATTTPAAVSPPAPGQTLTATGPIQPTGTPAHPPGHAYGHRFGPGGHGNPHWRSGGGNGGGND